ncbi:MAG: hydrogenase subunit MbhD domain-containing protein [Desulfurococcaceae archaeon]
MLAELIIYLIMAVLGIMSTIAVYLAIKERDLVKAVVYSALQSSFYAVLYYFLMAPDIVLVYLPVAVGLVPGVLLILISKTERWEKNEAS